MVDKQQLAAMGEHMREMEECKPEFKVPDGWRLVPVEPTSEMILTGIAAQDEKLKRYALGGSLAPIDHGMLDAYNSMLASTPEYKP